MSNIYIGYHFTIEPKELGSEILIAELEATPFESFIETEQGLSAYIQKEFWTENVLEDIFILNSPEFKIEYTFEEIEQVNWNEEWEKNFEPIDVDGKCHVRAPFHPKTDAEFDILIEPKMSFGTGHHETTHMMIQHLLEMDVKGQLRMTELITPEKIKSQQDIDAIVKTIYKNEGSVAETVQNLCNTFSQNLIKSKELPM